MVHCSATEASLISKLCDDFRDHVSERLKHSGSIHIALSGGNTPRDFLSTLAADQIEKNKIVPWDRIHFYWSDERCVPPNDTESNYNMAYLALFSRIKMNPKNIHRMMGENDPFQEAKRYAKEIAELVPCNKNIPVFDLIFLGTGEDGHCASIFPDRMDLLNAPQICEPVKHPASGKYRITLTGQPLIIARRTVFLVTGIKKSKIISEIFNNADSGSQYPASWVSLKAVNTDWYLDSEAGKHIKLTCRG